MAQEEKEFFRAIEIVLEKESVMEKPRCICETFIADITRVRCPIHGKVGPLNSEKADRFYRLCMDMTWGDWFEDDEKESLGSPKILDKDVITHYEVPKMEFYCIVCKQMRTGPCKASVDIGGWVCLHHTLP